MSGVATIHDVEAIEARGAPDLPLTAVGKIYKPALRRREANDAIAAALLEGGVAFRTLEIVDDTSRGMRVRLELDAAASREDARKVLGRFSLPYAMS